MSTNTNWSWYHPTASKYIAVEDNETDANICHIYYGKWRRNIAEAEAIADLISAAPEMLAALQAFPHNGQHNLCSTATREERSEFIRDVLNWRNQYIVKQEEEK